MQEKEGFGLLQTIRGRMPDGASDPGDFLRASYRTSKEAKDRAS